MSGSTTSATTSPALSITTLRPQEPLSADSQRAACVAESIIPAATQRITFQRRPFPLKSITIRHYEPLSAESQRAACVAESIIPASTQQITFQIPPLPWKSMGLLQVVENMEALQEALQILQKPYKTVCKQLEDEFNKGGERLETLIPEMEWFIFNHYDHIFVITDEITISNAKRILRILPKISWVFYSCPSDYITDNMPDALDDIHIFADNGFINSQNEDGETILIKTVQTNGRTTGSVERRDNLVKMLLNAHADPNIPDAYGRTALIEAAARGNDIAVQRLIEARANVDHQDRVGCFVNDELCSFERDLFKASEKTDIQVKNGATALMTAAVNDHLTIVKRLINAGADLFLRCEAGYTAKMCAYRMSLYKKSILNSSQILDKAEKSQRQWKIISFALIFLRANRDQSFAKVNQDHFLNHSFSTLIPQILEYGEGSKTLNDKLENNLSAIFIVNAVRDVWLDLNRPKKNNIPSS